MAQDPRPLVAGNWKMNGLAASVAELEAIMAGVAEKAPAADLMICPPATLISLFAKTAAGSGIAIGAQDCHAEVSGAFTGDLSAEMLKDAGASAVIVGHSERRTLHGESDEMVRAKAIAARRAGLTAILCVGETREEREANATIARIHRQLDGSLPDTLDGLVIAYEPVWAIGTGLTPTPEDVAKVHEMIRNYLISKDKSAGPAIRILYGGSVKPQNARELMAVRNVNGALVGGASLKAADFLGIAAAYA
ncbi:triose-phosphate isomerase [Pseudorhodoplanes sp.]|uniref:triose-phosphate isomerase n=1 Tax=Pseudorhodoplanes sp. TaxID=1934341 RepID=UPI002BE83BED|nr:triose-phosphate isomerase [Pseudorhodoplanes sp.]HWV40129.1 triose-phosphate isomerase [Pseudorhodoplanes sp.]